MSIPRKRTKNETSVRHAMCDNIWKSAPMTTGPFIDTVVGSTSTIEDFITPGYKKIMARGGIVNNSMHLFRVTLESGDSTLVVGEPGTSDLALRFHGDCGKYFQDLALRPVTPSCWDVEGLRQLVLAKVYADSNKAAVMGGELLATMETTASMLRRPLAGAVDLLRQMAKYKAKHRGKTLKSALKAESGAWLETRYGWIPLVLDGREIMKQFNTSFERMRERRLVARSSVSRNLRSSRTYADYQTSDGIRLSGTTTVSRKVRVAAGYIYTLAAEELDSDMLKRIAGMDNRDLIPTLWELVPMSFVADWFYNTGTWLEAINPREGVQGLTAWVTVVDEIVTDINGTWSYNRKGALPKWYTATYAPVREKTVDVFRDSQPVLNHNSPVSTQQQSLSSLHSVDAICLAAQTVAGQLRTGSYRL